MKSINLYYHEPCGCHRVYAALIDNDSVTTTQATLDYAPSEVATHMRKEHNLGSDVVMSIVKKDNAQEIIDALHVEQQERYGE